MMDSNQVVQLKNVFDQIVHITEDGIEFWYARELQSALGYTRWENFVNAIEKAKVSCASSGRDVDGCFRDVTKTSPMPNGGTKDIADVMLIRYACYLIAQNGDPRKPEIAFAQAYFALQTRKQELLEQRISDLNRVQQRQQLRTSEKRLSQNIYERGVDDRGFARIRSKGDSALFGGRTTEEMKMQYSEMFECYDRSQKKILSDMLSDESCLHQIVNSIYLYLKATEEQVHEAEELLKGEAELDLRGADSSDMELCLFRASRAVEDYMKHLKHEKLKELSVEVDIENL